MSLEQIRNVVLLFSNPVWSGANTVPSTIIRNITSLSRSIAYQDTISANLTTLSGTNSETQDGIIRGLLYVPDLNVANPCYQQQYDIIPRNATTQATLPPTNYNLIAIAPWFNASCTQAYLSSARLDPIRAFIFYRPNNSTKEPQGADSPIWDLDDNDAWRSQNRFPIFAIPGAEGNKMMRALSLYSGNLSTIPYGDQIQDIYEPHENDFVRIWTELTVKDRDSVPAMWTWILTVVGVVLFIVACLSLTMHLVQRRRRISLRRRVLIGEVDLEAMGIKRVTVPVDHVKSFPLFTYSFQPEMISTPSTTRPPRSIRSPRSQRTISESTITKSRARRSSMNSATSTVATNYQPQCHICLETYIDRDSIIRELPCGHIFHPECIDEFLSLNSSLCPICKRNMLPRNYCPKITNGMVRRERALRRLRERVIVVESDDEEEGMKGKSWGKRLFGTDKAASSPKETPMTPVTPSRSPKTAQELASARTPAPAETEATHRSTLEPTQEEQEDSDQPSSQSGGQDPDQSQPQPPPAAYHPRRNKRRKLGGLRLHVPDPEEHNQPTNKPEGRKSPSALARARMRALAGTPLDDPDGRNPIWKRYVVKVFPGFS
ncbi:RING finger domain-containing protein [Colletotrichum truncatum]|uniref:RING finger domain-containing protein n=1 Tax=Colletotrichum truncatum TaxID=5467 RepID=A0ACC3YTN7_COLTU|nr:RING finger domain-containing protein [Colletotrichum truncatum]KAF6798476.1 RING finger domain-containing protein [Colletotrichum truncatum]